MSWWKRKKKIVKKEDNVCGTILLILGKIRLMPENNPLLVIPGGGADDRNSTKDKDKPKVSN